MFLWFCRSWSALGALITHHYEVFMGVIKIFLYRVVQKLVHMGQKNVCGIWAFFYEKRSSYPKI